MHSLEMTKPDGRRLTLYSRAPITAAGPAPSPFAQPLQANPHLRWHPLRAEWVIYSPARQDRTFLPPPEFNPLAVTRDPAWPTELPQGDYDIAVFDNRFPALSLAAHDPPPCVVPSAPAQGQCEVVVFTQDPASALCQLPLSHIELLLAVWAERTRRLAEGGQIRYVLPFENRGAEVGVTLHHPHGQLYGYPFVPPVPARMLETERQFYAERGGNLLHELALRERAEGTRVLYAGPHALAFVPAWARYPYEVWITPLSPVPSLDALRADQRADLARALKTVLLKYERLWQRPFPYLMVWYQAPCDGAPHPESQLHAEFYPPYRSRERLKYLAGTELGAGAFAMDTLPETTAAELQAVDVTLELA
ncbi:galactose-1-phosphate uridylyltransferase [Massilia sp. TS11]|uniref:galactose-1-phosphate uridylyltransferase n=1 Tax=Massilia sp. TS11 TaxID=2908003 RepID=UPI001EDB2113|nr:galactose-1-phosphate uridylyltransferase [Massilia sp. TS11]MCG2584317.1 galactose-1-phosphate uridylyltransferase [Massilia sp. TS11]